MLPHLDRHEVTILFHPPSLLLPQEAHPLPTLGVMLRFTNRLILGRPSIVRDRRRHRKSSCAILVDADNGVSHGQF